MRWEGCSADNLALICLNKPFVFNKRETYTEFLLNRARYGVAISPENRIRDKSCRFYGWGSRRNVSSYIIKIYKTIFLLLLYIFKCIITLYFKGYLIPLLIHLYKMDVTILPTEDCAPIFNYGDKFLCIQQPKCKVIIYSSLE